ncbi:PREDICTED: Williams-Beuren syndrome chromosomal region 28 protein [Ceratotherium simum simum]|uniref:Williams-Beuren syndrome chromosomal region 28 protein n=1 Tax=Ceratotherium simum simum TaxID=73337 RepID=A0ABM0I7R3_CERSS|nr:PREDICTED: Williams-Beuren syndrome chromosomal region 28 protein [Ceratotherium simum simum]
MEVVPPVRSSLVGILLLVGKLSVLLVQNRVRLYNFLLLKIVLFNHWLSGLAQEAQGSRGWQAHSLPPALTACPMGRVLRAGLALMEVPVRLVLRAPRLVWTGMLGCARALGLAPKRLGAWEQPGLSVATWTDLSLSCLHSLMLAVLLLLLLTWRLCWTAHRCSLGWLPSKAALEKRVVRELLALLKRLYWRVESAAVLTSWHLAYLLTWTTCLASHLLHAAFEHTAQLARAQEVEPQEAPGPLSESLLPEPLVPQAGPVLPEHGTPGE